MKTFILVLLLAAGGCAGYLPPTQAEWRASCAADGYTGENVNACAERRNNARNARVRDNNQQLRDHQKSMGH